MEFNPHGNAHTSFDGSIASIPTAAKDPLFFLLPLQRRSPLG